MMKIIISVGDFSIMAISFDNNLFFKGQMELTSLIFNSHEFYYHPDLRLTNHGYSISNYIVLIKPDALRSEKLGLD